MIHLIEERIRTREIGLRHRDALVRLRDALEEQSGSSRELLWLSNRSSPRRLSFPALKADEGANR
jgi:hypothetical protein